MAGEISIEVIKKTQKSLGKYVKKPPLTEKLLKKPPFRFLHDVIHAVIKETGYLKGLFSEEELVSDNVKDKEAKIAFLDKFIEAVKNTTKIKLPVRSSKIVAGLEPVNTNLLLQAIGKALDAKIDSSDYVVKLKSEDPKGIKTSTPKESKSKSSSRTKILKNKEDKHAKSSNETPKSRKAEDEIPKLRKIGDETPKSQKAQGSRDSSRNPASSKNKIKKEAQKMNDKKHASNDEKNNVPHIENSSNEEEKDMHEKGQNEENNIDININIKGEVDGLDPQAHTEDNEKTKTETTSDTNKRKGNFVETEDNVHNNMNLVRPKSAKPKSADKKSPPTVLTDSTNQEVVQKTQDLTASNPIRPRSSLRPPSVRPSSARPGAPRLRPESALPLQETVTMGNINVIVENIDLADDEETVVIEAASELPKEMSTSPEVVGDNKGQLVEQILEQIKEEEGIKKKTDIDWEADAFRNKDAAYKEVHQLRTYIQNLTKTANPLGKLMNYLHEDIDAMHGELQMWINTKKQLSAEIRKQKKISVEANKPLFANLEQMRQEIGKVKQEILMTQSNIFKNDVRIKELLSN
ncbi:hypothetical protein JTB14_029078 [Gonioctena quinquepunctata]|nr:hypothetical protein JTB14_029078 [Gonioctena quinquepunctata]